MKVDKLQPNNQPENWLEIVMWECREYPIQLVQIQKDELVLDIGANVGGFWKVWGEISNNWELIEPSKYNCEQIEKNGYEGIYKRNAVGKKSGEVVKLQKYWVEDNDTLSGNFGTTQFVNPKNQHGWQGEWEECVTLSCEDVIRGREVGLMKIDCEGGEYDFLMHKELSTIKWIVGEFHNFLGVEKQKELFDWIGRTHKEILSTGDGVTNHFVKLWERK